jgi:hypothetical protein
MQLDIKTYTRECPCCQKMSQIKIPITVYKDTTSTYRPMEFLNMDFIGPYPDKGNVLNIIDTYMLYLTLRQKKHANVFSYTSDVLEVQHLSVLTKVRTLIEQFLKATGTLQNLTLAYSSQENAIVERNHKEINRPLRALTFDTSTVNDYQQLLPFVQRILNSSYNQRTKISPADLLFGNSLDLSGGIYNSIH